MLVDTAKKIAAVLNFDWTLFYEQQKGKEKMNNNTNVNEATVTVAQSDERNVKEYASVEEKYLCEQLELLAEVAKKDIEFTEKKEYTYNLGGQCSIAETMCKIAEALKLIR